MDRTLFSLDGLDRHPAFFQSLRSLSREAVHDRLLTLRENELRAGARERWQTEHRDELALLRSVVAQHGLGNPDDIVGSYLRYRLVNRPLSFCMLGLYGEDPDFRQEFVRLEGYETLDRLSREGRGAVLLGSHFGPHTVVPYLIAACGQRVVTVLPNEDRDLIARLGVTYCPTVHRRVSLLGVPDRRLLFKCLSALDKGKSVFIFNEFSRSDAPSKTTARFLGLTLPVPEGGAFLAAASGAPLIPVHALHEDDLRIRLAFEEPISVPRVPRRHLGDIAQRLWSDLECKVLGHPEQWLGWEVLARNPAAMDRLLSVA